MTHARQQRHVDHIRLFANSDFDVTKDLLDQLRFDRERNFEVEKIKSVRMSPLNHALEVLVKWQGYVVEESSREPLANISVDVPDLVTEFPHAINGEE